MTPLCAQIVREHMVRRGRARKAAFRALVRERMREQGVFLREERARGLFENVNLVGGNVERADVVIGAHYDTCAEMPFPNLVAPLNWPVTLLYQLGLVACMALCALLPALAARALGAAPWVYWPVFGAGMLAMSALMVFGPANPRTMNDNTSGVVAALTLLSRMTRAQRSRVAVVLFDNEEMGLVGSTLFRRRHARAMEGTPLINLDCVGEGRTALFAAGAAYRADEDLWARTRSAFPSGEYEALHLPAWRAFYPSDQFGFKKSLAVATLRRARGVGPMLGRIHTRRDTVLDEANIDYIVEGLLRLIGDEDE